MKITIVFIFSLIIFLACSSSESEKEKALANKEKQLLERENQLLKKENQLLILQQDSIKRASKNKIRNQPNTQKNNTEPNNIYFLSNYNGKYPREVNFLENQIIETRIRKFIGSEYNFIKSIWQVQIPIEINNGILYAYAMEAHSGGDPSAVIMADINRNVFFVGIRKDRKITLYSEDGSIVPQKLRDYRDEF